MLVSVVINFMNKEYYKKNKDKIALSLKRYYLAHKKEISEYKKKYRQENRERLNFQHAEWSKKNKDHILDYQRQWRKNNKVKVLERSKRYREAHKDRVTLSSKQYYLNHKDRVAKNAKVFRETHRKLIAERSSKYYLKNKEKIKLRNAIWSNKNKSKRQEITQRWEGNNKSLIALRRKQKYKDDPFVYIRNNKRMRSTPHGMLRSVISHRINEYLKRRTTNKNGKSIIKFLPYTIDQLKEHLEKQFKPGMSWNNRSKWHVDHIKPDCLFHYTSVDDPEFQKCWALENLQPLWAKDNFSKNSKYDPNN